MHQIGPKNENKSETQDTKGNHAPQNMQYQHATELLQIGFYT